MAGGPQYVLRIWSGRPYTIQRFRGEREEGEREKERERERERERKRERGSKL
jgi:hypothetical protein